jgi:voltage-gated potassium channel Kch
VSGVAVRRSRRAHARSVLRSLVGAAGLVAAYYLLPLREGFSARTLLALGLGLAGVAVLLGWQVRRIVRSPYPRLRAAQALAVIAPLFVLLFATTYYLLARTTPGTFSAHLTRTDALYFSVTVLSTVGFGDITPRSETARLITTGQMVSDLILIGFAARVLVGAAQEGVRRRDRERAGQGLAGERE